MFRKKIAGASQERKDRIAWRSHEVTRIEAFSDAVFAFAITLLIVSLEVPETFEELMHGMQSFFSFAICFAMIFYVWITQNTFFRRFGLSDSATLVLNGALLFFVLFFVYPLKFLFSGLIMRNDKIHSLHDLAQVFAVYSGGFFAIYLLFTLMYWNAFQKRHSLNLTAGEVYETRTNIYANLSMSMVGLASVLWAGLFPAFSQWAGIPYFVIGPMVGMIYSRRAKKHPAKLEPVVVTSVVE